MLEFQFLLGCYILGDRRKEDQHRSYSPSICQAYSRYPRQCYKQMKLENKAKLLTERSLLVIPLRNHLDYQNSKETRMALQRTLAHLRIRRRIEI